MRKSMSTPVGGDVYIILGLVEFYMRGRQLTGICHTSKYSLITFTVSAFGWSLHTSASASAAESALTNVGIV